nr:ATP-binding protein [Oscillospiraceae bacterium]
MELYRRETYLKKIRGFYHAADIIKVISGVRRCGKSSLMQMIADELRAGADEGAQIIFLNLDKRGYRKIKTADQLDELIASFPKATGMTYLFIDEIQNVEDFEEVVNAYREEGGYSVFITGSNSCLLSGELVTKLTGRYVELEMFPLTFDEYLGMKAFYGKPVDANLFIEMNRYILEGGFPRTVLLDELADKRSYTQSVVNEIFEKDIRKRAKIKDKEAFEAVRRFIINNFGATTSVSSLHESLVKSGMNITRATVTKYISVLVSAKILYECDRFDMKSKRALKGEKKYYLSDLSFYFCDNTDNRINYGPVLENITYCYAKSHGYSVSVGRVGTLECDFILRNRNADYAYLQVAYTIAQSRETEEREYRSLERIKDNYPKYLLTTDYLLQK